MQTSDHSALYWQQEVTQVGQFFISLTLLKLSSLDLREQPQYFSTSRTCFIKGCLKGDGEHFDISPVWQEVHITLICHVRFHSYSTFDQGLPLYAFKC